jgi:opacity protein-like surface antigen
MKINFVIIFIAIIFYQNIAAQNTLPPFKRQSVHNNIGWYGYFGDHKISAKWSIHTEYQWRRENFINYWQQSLARVGVNYKLTDKVILTAGYGFIETFTYGNPALSRRNNQGEEQSFPEHRLYQDALLNNDLSGFEISHRLRLEQRWLGTFYDANNDRVAGKWRYLNRFRYRFRIAHSLKGKTIDAKELYLHAYDEFFIGFGKDVGANVFDQNRINIGLGYKINGASKIEAGYFNQIVQQSRLNADKNPVFEYNNGFLITLFYNFDFSKKVSLDKN